MISIIMPTIGRCDIIRYAIDSVKNQSEENFECLISVSGNQSGYEWLDDLDKRFVIYRTVKALNAATSRNILLDKARGEYIAYLDDDDYYLPHHLQLLSSILDESNLDGVYSISCIRHVHRINGKWMITPTIVTTSNTFSPKAVSEGTVWGTCAFMHRRWPIDNGWSFPGEFSGNGEDGMAWRDLVAMTEKIRHEKTLTCEVRWWAGARNIEIKNFEAPMPPKPKDLSCLTPL